MSEHVRLCVSFEIRTGVEQGGILCKVLTGNAKRSELASSLDAGSGAPSSEKSSGLCCPFPSQWSLSPRDYLHFGGFSLVASIVTDSGNSERQTICSVRTNHPLSFPGLPESQLRSVVRLPLKIGCFDGTFLLPCI